MYTLGAGRIWIKCIIIVCLLNLLAWKASWAHRTGENEKKKDNDKIKKSVQTSSACEQTQRDRLALYTLKVKAYISLGHGQSMQIHIMPRE